MACQIVFPVKDTCSAVFLVIAPSINLKVISNPIDFDRQPQIIIYQGGIVGLKNSRLSKPNIVENVFLQIYDEIGVPVGERFELIGNCQIVFSRPPNSANMVRISISPLN